MRTNDGRTLDQRISDAITRAESRLDKTGDCWLWPGGTNGKGYGVLSVKTGNGRESVMLYTHRVMWERTKGPIPSGMEIDHLCRNRACGNPDHLEAVTHAENVRRQAAAITHCIKGHPFDAANTVVRGGKRICLTCRADAKWLQRNPGATLDDPRRRGRYKRNHQSSSPPYR